MIVGSMTRRNLASAIISAVLITLTACAGNSNSIDATANTSVFGSVDPTDLAVDRLLPGEAEAIVALGRTGVGPPMSHEGMTHGDTAVEGPLNSADEVIFQDQWLNAQGAIPKYDTLDEIIPLGFVRASAVVGGIGVHWVLWSQIAKPFEPARPAMLLFNETREPPVLVGYSYALQTPTRPAGFAGDNDQRHQHTGLCVNKDGWVIREKSAGPEACDGTYIAGGDFWMLHVWLVPGWENVSGKFASFNPKLCPPDAGTPDFARCNQ